MAVHGRAPPALRRLPLGKGLLLAFLIQLLMFSHYLHVVRGDTPPLQQNSSENGGIDWSQRVWENGLGFKLDPAGAGVHQCSYPFEVISLVLTHSFTSCDHRQGPRSLLRYSKIAGLRRKRKQWNFRR